MTASGQNTSLEESKSTGSPAPRPELVIRGIIRKTRHGEYKCAGGPSNSRGFFAGNQASIHGESKSGGGPAPRPELTTKASKDSKTVTSLHKHK